MGAGISNCSAGKHPESTRATAIPIGQRGHNHKTRLQSPEYGTTIAYTVFDREYGGVSQCLIGNIADDHECNRFATLV